MTKHWGIPWWILAGAMIVMASLAYCIYYKMEPWMYPSVTYITDPSAPPPPKPLLIWGLPWWVVSGAGAAILAAIVFDVIEYRRRRAMV